LVTKEYKPYNPKIDQIIANQTIFLDTKSPVSLISFLKVSFFLQLEHAIIEYIPFFHIYQYENYADYK